MSPTCTCAARCCASSATPLIELDGRIEKAALWGMYPRKPLSHGEQLARLKTYLRRARTDLRRKYDEFFEATKGRRDCPLEVQVRHRPVDHAQSIVRLLEVCLEEVQRQDAIFHAPFKPGDRIEIERQGGAAFDSFLVVDVLPDKKTRYCYECVALAKHGSMYKKGGNIRVWPKSWTTIRASAALLNEQGARESEYFRRCAETSRVLSMEKGDVRLFEAQKTARGLVHYKRKDLLDPLPPEAQ